MSEVRAGITEKIEWIEVADRVPDTARDVLLRTEWNGKTWILIAQFERIWYDTSGSAIDDVMGIAIRWAELPKGEQMPRSTQ